jgi:hypothetical protein
MSYSINSVLANHSQAQVSELKEKIRHTKTSTDAASAQQVRVLFVIRLHL